MKVRIPKQRCSLSKASFGCIPTPFDSKAKDQFPKFGMTMKGGQPIAASL